MSNTMYGGTKGEMERLLVDAEKLSGQKYDIGNFSDVIEAIHVVQDEMGITGTTALEASETISGSLNATKSAWSNLLAGMTDENADFDSLINNLVDSASTFGKNILPRIAFALEGIGELVRTLLPKILDGIPEMMSSLFPESMQEDIKRIFEGIVEAIKTTADIAMQWLPKIAEGFAWIIDHGNEITGAILGTVAALGIFKALMMTMAIVGTVTKLIKAYQAGTLAATLAQMGLNVAILANPFTWIALAIAALVGGIIYLWTTNEGFRGAIIGAWNAIKEAGVATWGWLVKFFTEDIPAAWNSMIEWFSSVGEWFSTLWATIKQVFIDGWNGIVSFFTESIPAWWEGVKQSFVDGWKAITDFFTETIPAWIEQIFNWFGELPGKIGYQLGLLLGTIAKWGLDTWTYLTTNVPIWIEAIVTFFSELPGKIWTWLVEAFNKIVQWGTDTYTSATKSISNTINTIVTFFSELPGKILVWLLQSITNIATWGSNLYKTSIDWVSATVNSIIDWFSQLPGRIWTWLCNVVSDISSWGSNMVSQGVSAASNLVNEMVSTVASLPSKFMDIGENIVRGVWDGITGMGSWLMGNVTGFFDGILKGVKKSEEIHSPSRKYRDQVGKYMAQGVGVGFEDETKNVQDKVNKSLSDMTAKLNTTVMLETSKTSQGIRGRSGILNNNSNTSSVTHNDNGVTQNVTIVSPEGTPSENARALKKVGRDLCFGY